MKINTKKWELVKDISGMSISKNLLSPSGKICGWGGHFWYPYKVKNGIGYFQPLNPFL